MSDLYDEIVDLIYKIDDQDLKKKCLEKLEEILDEIKNKNLLEPKSGLIKLKEALVKLLEEEEDSSDEEF